MYNILIKECSFPHAWERAILKVLSSPEHIVFGGGNERKKALDSRAMIVLDRHAIDDILKWKFHPSDPFCSELKLKEYIKEYKEGFNHNLFDYTYRGRLEEGFKKLSGDPINQLDHLREGLKIQIEEELPSNRNVAILYNPQIDYFSELSMPCWNEISVRWEGNGWCSVNTTFRSHDLAQAWESNMICIVDMINEEVVKPNNCRIKLWTEHNYSLHIYEHNVPDLRQIKKLPRHPSLMGIQRVYDEE